MTFIHFYTVWATQMQNYGFGSELRVFRYQTFVHSWYAFLRLLDYDESDGFSCDKCGDCPDIVICDGTSLGFRRQLLNSLIDKNVKNDEVAVKRFR